MKLLLVDDDVFLRDMYAIKFTDSGFDVAAAGSAEQALGLIEKTPHFDIVLTDMVMPGMTGVELIQQINDLFADMKACSIVLTNQGQKSDIVAAKKAGAAGYIIKAEAIPSDVVTQVTKIFKSNKT